MWTFYFALAPVVWLPGLSTSIVAAIKAALFAGAVWTTWAYASRRWLPPGILGPLGGSVLFLAAASGLLQADSTKDVAVNLYSLALPFVVLWSFWNLPQLRGNLMRVVVPAAGFLAFLSVLIIYADIARPEALSGPYPQAARAAWVSGFNTQSTGWSHGVALYVPFLAVAAMSGGRRIKIATTAAIALIIAGQFIVFGRGGLAISVMSLLVLLGVRYRDHLVWFLAAAALLVPVAVLATDSGQPEPFPQGDAIGLEQIDRFSSSRVELLELGVTRLAERPLAGYGFGNDWIETSAGRLQIHVTWIRMAVQGGIIFPITLLAIVGTIVVRTFGVVRAAKRSEEYLPLLASGLVILGGLVASLIEPSAIIGAFHASALWWAAAGVITRLAFNRDANVRRTRHYVRSASP